MEITFSKLSLPSSGTAVIAVTEENLNSENLSKFVTKSTIKFEGKFKEIALASPPQDHDLDMVLLVGLGKSSQITKARMQIVGGNITSFLNKSKIEKASIVLDDVSNSPIENPEIAAHITYGAALNNYKFSKYFTGKKLEKNKLTLEKLDVRLEKSDAANKIYKDLEIIKSGVFLARDLVTEPANILTTENYAKECQKLSQIGIKVEVLGEKEMRKLGMNSLLCVGQGSDSESKLVVMEWNGSENKDDKPLAFVGKGVVFDTGGISLKPSAKMGDMKADMGGSAAVVGLMKVLAQRNAKVNVVGVVGLVENMPSSKAQRPGDVVKSMSGQTIEVLNTDAEGRLVLADALHYTNVNFQPKIMVNLATLTGAIMVALADIYGGLFSNDDELAENLTQAGLETDEKLWRMPIGDDYDQMIDSDIADMKNIGSPRGAGSITAAQFLHRFVGETKWAHLDIAGMALIDTPKDIYPKGGTGYGVRLLNQFVQDNYEKKIK